MWTRQRTLVTGWIAMLGVVCFIGCSAQKATETMHQFSLQDIEGNQQPLADYKGKVVLVVNVASKCGFTPQYEGLQALHEQRAGEGLVVLGVPSNDFGAQEPGTDAEVKTFCSTNFGVTFPMLTKMPVKNGASQSDLYQFLTQKGRNGVLDAEIKWNFNKILVGKDGVPIKHYESKVTPDDPGLAADIQAALG